MPLTLSNDAAALLVAEIKMLIRHGDEIACVLRLQAIYSEGFNAGVEAYYERLIEANRDPQTARPLGALRNDDRLDPAEGSAPGQIVAPAPRQSER